MGKYIRCNVRQEDANIKAYKSIIRPVLLYGSETWALNATEEKLLQTTEMGMIRWSLGYTKLDHMTNDYLRA
ncbi:unnamed protein product [Gordionus sp. m RMFG-2023]